MGAVLDRFADRQRHGPPGAFAKALALSPPTAYRYLRALTEAAHLHRLLDTRPGDIAAAGPRLA
jgi:DNA-binding IclR family transcriptional regulator